MFRIKPLPKHELFLFLLLGASSLPSYAVQNVGRASAEESLFDLPFNEALQLRVAVPAALTKLRSAETPASITVITAEDIKYTPARNIYDLIEVYVPGAIWMNYEDGPQLGVRGNIANRNYKYLLRVNGRVMNSKGHYGAKSELEQWDMSDIQRIEIVRGPGSVIYGPGAVAGVINIITHTAETAEGLSVAGRYVDRYDSRGLTVSHGHKGKTFNLFSFGSFSRTSGFGARHFIGTNNQTAGYVGEDILPAAEPLDYFADSQGDPQVKLHLDVDFKDHWRFWSRYTQQGSTWKGNEIKTHFANLGLLNQQGLRDRQWTNTLQYDNELREDLSIATMLSMDTFDIERRRDVTHHPDPDHVLNKETNFSETEVFVRSQLNWQASDALEIALGSEYAWDHFGPGWGDDEKDMRLGEDGIIVSGPGSNAMDPTSAGYADKDGTALFVGNGWSTNTYSFFTETNLTLSSMLKLLMSARADKNTYSDWLYSPRIALIADVATGHNLKLIAQQSQRMATAGQLYALHQNNNDPDSETLNAVEFIYSAFADKPLSFSVATFWHDAEVIAWNQAAQSSTEVGNLKLFGIEPELSYTWSEGIIGVNYSFVKQLDWQLAGGVPSSGISYSDYNLPLSGSTGIQTGVGNDLNNWPNEALKFHGRVALCEKLMFHVDGRFVWDFQGAKDGLTGLADAVDGLPEEPAVDAAIQKAEDAGAYEYDFRLNASVSAEAGEHLTIQVFGQNLLGQDGNKRYSYDTGNNKASPHRVRFVEEPRTFGVRAIYEF